MNGMKGKISYGHDVYETAVNIPLIAPRIDEKRIRETLYIVIVHSMHSQIENLLL